MWAAVATLCVANVLLTGCTETGESGSAGGDGTPTIVLVTLDGLPRDYLEPFGGAVPAPSFARLAGMGGFFSRPYGSWSRFAYDREGMHAMGQKKLKDIFDPKRIMNPGKLCF